MLLKDKRSFFGTTAAGGNFEGKGPACVCTVYRSIHCQNYDLVIKNRVEIADSELIVRRCLTSPSLKNCADLFLTSHLSP